VCFRFLSRPPRGRFRLSDDSHRARSLILAAALTSAAASASWAQTDWRLDANFVRLRPAGASKTSALSILGLAQQQIGPVTPTLSGAATISGDSVAAAQLLMGAGIIPPWSERTPIDIGAVVALYGIAEGDRGQSRVLYLRQHLRYDRRGFWIGGAIAQIDRTVSFASNSVDAGGWLSWGRKRLTAAVTSIATTDRDVFRHTALVPDQFAERVRVADASLVLEYVTNRFELEATVGGRVAIEGLDGSRGFAVGSIAWRLARSASLVFSGGSQLADPLRGTPEWKFFSAGVRFSKSPSGSVIPRGPAAPPVSAERVADGAMRFTVDAPFSSTSVEVAGTFTEWVAVPLELEGDTWVITLPAASGPHRLRVRVNGGEWRVPSNLTAGRDEYGARYGIIIVP
jgi:hypothetical protein